ncbi:MAG: OPT family oligopeptide transporter [Phycisphaerae bacterium]
MEREPSPRAQRDAAANNVAEEAPTTAERVRQTAGWEPAPLGRRSPQFTPRAVLTGMVLGGLLSVCNVYVGLTLGWAFGMSITAAVLGYGLWSTLHALSGRRIRPFGILENNISQTACSSGAYVASAGLVAPIPALTLLTGRTLPWHHLALWVFSVMLVGVVVAVALRRQLLIVDKLRFPGGLASAEMLRELHGGGSEAAARLIALASAGLVAVATKLFAGFKLLLPYGLPFSIRGLEAGSLTMTLNPSLLPVGIGGLIGFRACCSLLVGAILAYGVISPALIRNNYMRVTVSAPLPMLPAGVAFVPEEGRYARYNEEQRLLQWAGIMTAAERDELLARSKQATYQAAVQALYVTSQSPRPSFRDDLNKWLLWPGATLMVLGALVSLCFSWRSILAALLGWRVREVAPADAQETGQVSRRWFVFGLLGALILSVVLQISFFGIVWWAAVLGVFLAFALALVAARVAGETGIGTVGPMGKVAQLLFGFLVPQNPAANLMAANVTGGAASQCADLLDDLKCGYLLGASPRLQTLAQLCGALAGALVGSAVYLILIPNPTEQLLTDEWPAPAAVTWKAVAELFVVGFGALPKGAPTAMILAALAAIVLPILERLAPRPLRPLVLSPVGFGLAFVVPASAAFSIFIGGLIALGLRHWLKNWSARFLVAVCVGLIAGESLTGIGMALVRVLMR